MNDLHANAWQNTKLAGDQDPNTIFKEGVLGNFEPKVPEQPSNQPGVLIACL